MISQGSSFPYRMGISETATKTLITDPANLIATDVYLFYYLYVKRLTPDCFFLII